MKMRRELSCDCCGVMVRLSRRRLRDLARDRAKPLCEQCRRYVRPGTARVSQLPSEQVVPALGLARKRGRGAKRVGVLASCPLARCGATGCDDEARRVIEG